MARLVLARVLGGIVLVTALTLITYVVWWQVPVDPLIYIYPDGAPEAQKQATREQLGLDQPVLEQWGRFTWRLATEGDLGTSLFERKPVNGILESALPPTLSLVLGGFVLMLALAIPLGMLSALRARTVFDRAVLMVVVLGIVLHPFVIGLVLRDVFSSKLGVAPPGTTLFQVARAAFPFLICDAILVGLLIVFPALALFLPGLMQ